MRRSTSILVPVFLFLGCVGLPSDDGIAQTPVTFSEVDPTVDIEGLDSFYKANPIKFDLGDATLSALQETQLRSLAKATIDAELGPAEIVIRGFADASGDLDTNVQLSSRRANAVADALAAAFDELADLDDEPTIATLAGGVRQGPAEDARVVEITVAFSSPELERVADSEPVFVQSGLDPANAPARDEFHEFGPTAQTVSYVAQDQRLSLDDGGLIEFWMSANWADGAKPAFDPVALAIGNVDDFVDLAVLVSADRDALLLWSGGTTPPVRLPVDLSDGRLRHIAVFLYEDAAAVAVDGEVLEVPFDFSRDGPDARAITLGSFPDGRIPLLGRVGRVRVWDRPMFLSDLEALRSMLGAPSEDLDISDAYVFGIFGDGNVERTPDAPLYPSTPTAEWWAPLGLTTLQLSQLTMAASEDLRPGLQTVAPIGKTRNNALQDLVQSLREAEAQVCPDRGPCDEEVKLEAIKPVLDAATSRLDRPDIGEAHVSYPLYRMISLAGVDMAALETGGRSRFDVKTRIRNGRMSGVRIWEGLSIRGLAVLDAELALNETPPVVGVADFEQQDRDSNRQDVVDIEFESGEEITGVSGTLRGGRLNDLAISTTARDYGPFAPIADPSQGDREARFSIKVPIGVQVLGFASDDEFRAIRLIVEDDASKPALALIMADGRGVRFVREARGVYRALMRQTPIPGHRPETTAPDWRPRLRLIDQGRMGLDGLDRILVAVEAEAPDSGQEVRFDDPSITLSKAVNLRSNFVGYDITRVDPIHLTRTGVDGEIFAPPEGGSSAYSDYDRVYVPDGLIYTPIFSGSSEQNTTTAKNATEYKRAVARSIGLSGGGGPATASASATMERARELFSETTMSRVIGQTRIMFYALSLDPARMRLSDRFRDEAALLASTGQYEAFIDAFGTHYAATVYYGGRGILDVRTDESVLGDVTSTSLEIKAEVSAMLKKATGGADFSTSTSESTSIRKELLEQVDNFYWVGGSQVGLAREEWSIGADGVVPIHVELRQIDELLSAFYFDDPEIYGPVRKALRDTIDSRIALLNEVERLTRPAPIYEVTVTLDRLACVNDEADSRTPARSYFPSGRSPSYIGVKRLYNDRLVPPEPDADPLQSKEGLRLVAAGDEGAEIVCGASLSAARKDSPNLLSLLAEPNKSATLRMGPDELANGGMRLDAIIDFLSPETSYFVDKVRVDWDELLCAGSAFSRCEIPPTEARTVRRELIINNLVNDRDAALAVERAGFNIRDPDGNITINVIETYILQYSVGFQ